MFWWLDYPLIPNLRKLWNQFDEPPTVYALLNSYVNFGKEDKTKITDLARAGRSAFFDFDYPLAEGWSKEDFEVMILNHFLMRRIGYETVTAFKIALNVKLNEIMPEYNRLFVSLKNWDLFKDGEMVIRDLTDNKNSNSTVQNTQTSISNGTDTANSTESSTNISDRRFSNTPQNQIDDVRDGKYVSEYNYDTNTNNSNSTSNATSSNNSTVNANGVNNSTDSTLQHETITRSPADKIRLYSEFLTAKQNLYTMIFKDLDSLFYQLV